MNVQGGTHDVLTNVFYFILWDTLFSTYLGHDEHSIKVFVQFKLEVVDAKQNLLNVSYHNVIIMLTNWLP